MLSVSLNSSGASLWVCWFLLPALNHGTVQLEPDPPRRGAGSLLEDAGLIENSLFSSPARKLHLQLLQKSCLSPKLGSALQLRSLQPRSLQPTSALRRESNFAASREIAHAKPTEKGGGLGLSSTHLSGLDVPSYSERQIGYRSLS